MGEKFKSLTVKIPIIFILGIWLVMMGGISSAAFAENAYWTDATTDEALENPLNIFPGEKRKVRLNVQIPETEVLRAYQLKINYEATNIEVESVEDSPGLKDKGFENTLNTIGTTNEIALSSFSTTGVSGADVPVLSLIDIVLTGKSNTISAISLAITVERFITQNTIDISASIIPQNAAINVDDTVAKIFYTNTDGITIPKVANLTTAGKDVFFNITVPAGGNLGLYQFTQTYDPALVAVDANTVVRTDGTAKASNDTVPGKIIFNGYETSPGIAGPTILKLVKIPLKAVSGQKTTQLDTVANFWGESAASPNSFKPAGSLPSLPIVVDAGFTITATAGTGGTITPSGAVTVASGGSQTFTISALSGYQISSVIVDGVSQGAIGSYPFTNVTANHTISATFTGGGVTPPPVTYPPSASFTADKTSGDAPLTVKFTDQSTNGPTSRAWDFGDGTTSTLQNPEHIYTKAGTYTVKLTVSNADGTDSMTRTAYITVSGLPTDKASIKVEYNVDGNKFKIRLTDVSTGSTSRKWYIDGVETGNGASSFAHTFTQAGTYTVKLDAVGADWTDSASLQIVVKDTGVLFSVFEFGIADDKLTANFTDKSEPASVITKRVWDFGDGSAPVETTLTALSHSYAAAGEYSVKLTVYTASGESAERTLKILVPGTGGVVVVGEINSDFTASVVSGIAPLKVQFASAATATNGISTYLWSFGDGGSSSEANPLYEYKNAGTWTVKLTVVGPDGSSVKEKANLITVSLNPVLVVDAPVPVAPQNGATSLEMAEFHLVPALEIAAYGDTTNTYGATRWEIAADPAFAEINVVWREKNTSTSLMMPDFVLDYGKMYWWRVRFADVNGVESEWSQVFSFTIANAASDDSNANGILDAQLSDCETVFAGMNIMKCARAEVGEGVFGIEAVENIMSAAFFRTYGTDYVPSEIDMPWGLTGFRVDLNAAGLTAKVKIHLSAAAAADAEWYINELWPLVPKKRAGSSAAEWSADRKSVILTLTDGGENDIDGIANGVIVVPFTGFGTAKAGEEECCSTGGSDSCFITTAAGGSYGVVMLFMAIIGAAGTIIRRK